MLDLQECRRKIDEIDEEILRLFQKRMEICEDVAAYKIKAGKKVLDPERERQKIETLKSRADSEFNALGVQELFQQIMAISRKRQYQLLAEQGAEEKEDFLFVKKLPLKNANVAFQGVEGAYSYAAMRAYFGEEIKSFHVKTWRDAMEAVKNGTADYAVLPIENSTAGIVADIYDLLTEYQLFIEGEQVIRVEHVLLGLPGTELSQIKKVVSHQQGLAQCKKYLENHQEWNRTEAANTAGAAKKVKEDGDVSQAAIASREAGEVFGLSVLAENICENQENSTRFIIVGKKPVCEEGAEKSACASNCLMRAELFIICCHTLFIMVLT